MTGKYQRNDGTVFDVILGKKGLEYAKVAGIGRNRLFMPITVEELKHQIKNKEIELLK